MIKQRILGFAQWLIIPRMLKRYAIGLTALAVLIALFYVEENWRGAREWQRVKAELEAQGESFDPATYIPAKIPDEDNFCATPLLANLCKTKFDHQKQATTWDNEEATTIISSLNEYDKNAAKEKLPPVYCRKTDNWTLGKGTDFDAWGNYYLSNREFAQAHPDARGAAAVVLHFSTHSDQWKELGKAAQLKYARFSISYENPRPYEVFVPASSCIELTKALSLKIGSEIAVKNIAQATLDIQILIKLSRAMSTEPDLLSQAVNMSIMNLAYQPLWEGLRAHSFHQEALNSLYSQFEGINLLSDFRLGIQGEAHVFFVRSMNYLQKNPQRSLALLPTWAPRGWYDANKAFFVRCMNDFGSAIQPSDHYVNVKKILEKEDFLKQRRFTISPATSAAKLVMPALKNLSLRTSQSQVQLDHAKIAILLEGYYLKNKKYPATLDQLGKELPHDVINGEPYRYQLTPDGRYKLWSVGWNEKDDGGTRGFFKPSFGTPKLEPQEGDWVWSYTSD